MNKVDPIYHSETRRRFPEASDADIDAARAYEDIFVPALFQEWPDHLISAASVEHDHHTLDIACGTGVLTRQLPGITGSETPPVGFDINPGMLEIAHQLNPDIIWQVGDAVALPFGGQRFHSVFCQYGLMFFSDQVQALKEMARVLRPCGRIVLAVWDGLDSNPGFDQKVEILDRVAGKPAGDALRAPFCLGDTKLLAQLANDAGLDLLQLDTIQGHAQFRSMKEFVDAEVYGWLPVMGVHLAEDIIATVHSECRNQLSSFVSKDGSCLKLPTSAHVLTLAPQAV